MLSFFSFCSVWAQQKKFKRVLVLSGGGMAPGIPLGIIAGLQQSGWRPDLIIGTCGSGLGAAVFNSEQSSSKALDIVTAPSMFEAFRRIRVATSDVRDALEILKVGIDTRYYPPLFDKTILRSPEYSHVPLSSETFRHGPRDTRAIILAARSLFSPKDQGLPRQTKPIFQQVYITDPETQKAIGSWELATLQSYPVTSLQREGRSLSGISLVNAARAGFADPFFLNPIKIQNDYYFTGAIDLYPIDLALSLGDEVIATYPVKLFEGYQDNAIYSAFGFTQSSRVLKAIQNTDVKWIDVSGDTELVFDPKRFLLTLKSGVPETYEEFKQGVFAQWEFGRTRAIEALEHAPGRSRNYRGHLRRPINPKLIERFVCSNAYEWQTESATNCIRDVDSGCDRTQAQWCHPLR